MSGVQSIAQQIGGYEIGPFDEWKYVAYMLLVIATVAAIFIDSSYYKKNRIITQYNISFFGILFISIVAFKIMQSD
jgi:hypothetical protein